MTLEKLAEEFWTWRVGTVPEDGDDVPRVERPPGWLPDWSARSIADRRSTLAELNRQYRELDLAAEPVSVQVDGRLLGSALARVHWELELIRGWQRDPGFYIDQSLTPIYNLLLPPPPFDDRRATAVIDLLRHVPVVLEQARENLAEHAGAPFARCTLRLLSEVDGSLDRAMAALAPELPERQAGELPAATRVATEAVAGFKTWLTERLPSLGDVEPIGPASLAYFLHRVALLPYPARQLQELGRQEWHRAVATEAILHRRYRDASKPALPATAAALVAKQAHEEYCVRGFYVYKGLLSQPDTLRHYKFAVRPAYLKELSWLGVCDDLAGPSRVDDDAFRYVEQPRNDLPYFDAAAAIDPRTAIVHEGVHAQQLALSWKHENPARRRFYDSVPNEGIAFYNEELMLLAGLFDEAPASAVWVANAMRLRALRVEVDFALALGQITIEQAADQLAEQVPMDRETAWEEAVSFAGHPGQALSYQIGKAQILDLLTTASGQLGDRFNLQEFHDRLWREGNVPLALQRWELLGRRDQLDEADRLAGVA